MALYRVAEEKIAVISEGYEQTRSMNQEAGNMSEKKKPYLLFIGRLEERKNIVRIVEAFELLKEKYQIPHKLVLVGKAGFRYERIRDYIQHSAFNIHIRELGYVTEEEKWELLRNADVFLFPTLYEGFGIPVLEAQSVGVPVVTSNTSSLPEVAGEGAVLVDPTSVESIAEGVQRLLSDQGLRSGIIEKATHNVSRYSWARCAKEIATYLV
jgi:glycosyltransferase involved in cell wall biosynthesis